MIIFSIIISISIFFFYWHILLHISTFQNIIITKRIFLKLSTRSIITFHIINYRRRGSERKPFVRNENEWRKFAQFPFHPSLNAAPCARARRERETKILFLRATPMENVVPNFRSPYPVDSIPPRIATRRATTLGDSTTWRFYVVARCASARRRNRIYYPPLRHRRRRRRRRLQQLNRI